MLPLPGAIHAPAMPCGSTSSAAGRLASTAAHTCTPRAPSSRPTLPHAHVQPHSAAPLCSSLPGPSPTQRAQHGPSAALPQRSAHGNLAAPMLLPGVLHLRLGALGCSGPASASHLRASVVQVQSAFSSTAGGEVGCNLEPGLRLLGRHQLEAGSSPNWTAGPLSCGQQSPLFITTIPGGVPPKLCRQGSTGSSSTEPRMWGQAGAAGRAPVPTRAIGTAAGVAAVSPSVAATSAALRAAGPASSPAASPLAALAAVTALPGATHRLLSTRAHAASPPDSEPFSPSGDGSDASSSTSASPSSRKKQKKKQQQQQQQQQPQIGSASGGSTAAASAVPVAVPPPVTVVRYSPLHYNIEDFSSRVVPTDGEKRQRHEVIEAVRAGVRRVWPSTRSAELQVFGSFANGLSTWSSDIDLVVTGVMVPDRLTGSYEVADRAKITARLRKIADALNRNLDIDILRQQLIPRARIPILKLWTRSRVCVDVSICDDSGPRAARYMLQQCRAFPPLKPLVLVLKTYLKACRLNEVNTGGLSSYSLTNMVIAHLQEELKAGRDVSDLGESLYTFLLRYGEDHDYRTLAVSVASGGIVPKTSLGVAMESARLAALSTGSGGSYDGAVGWSERLCVDCPLTGRDVSNGTYRIDLVRDAFQQAARKLEALARGRSLADTSLNYLQALFDVHRVLKRSYDPSAVQYEDDYIRVVGRRGDRQEESLEQEEEEGEELQLSPLDGTSDSDLLEGDGDPDDLYGDYLEKQPAGSWRGSSEGSGGGRGGGRQRQ